MNFDEKRGSFNSVKISYVDVSYGEMRVSLTGSAFDYFIKSSVGRVNEKQRKTLEDAESEFQELLDSYLVLMESKMRQLEIKLKELE
jgi:molecular chaperone DnaK (HSP70)